MWVSSILRWEWCSLVPTNFESRVWIRLSILGWHIGIRFDKVLGLFLQQRLDVTMLHVVIYHFFMLHVFDNCWNTTCDISSKSISEVLLWGEAGVSRETPPAWSGDCIPSHLPMLGIKHRVYWWEASVLTTSVIIERLCPQVQDQGNFCIYAIWACCILLAAQPPIPVLVSLCLTKETFKFRVDLFGVVVIDNLGSNPSRCKKTKHKNRQAFAWAFSLQSFC